MGRGQVIDLLNRERKIIAEIKNKHNTISGGKLSEQYLSLEKLVMPKTSVYYGYTAYFVNIIPKKPFRQDQEFVPSNKETGKSCHKNENIRIMDGACFYELVTGREHALRELYLAIPYFIKKAYEEVFGSEYDGSIDVEKFGEYFERAFGKSNHE